jgi:hypothetical protein
MFAVNISIFIFRCFISSSATSFSIFFISKSPTFSTSTTFYVLNSDDITSDRRSDETSYTGIPTTRNNQLLNNIACHSYTAISSTATIFSLSP